jgi:hypothetical protein
MVRRKSAQKNAKKSTNNHDESPCAYAFFAHFAANQPIRRPDEIGI